MEMSSNPEMGSPAPTKSPEPPRGEAGEGGERIESYVEWTVSEINGDIIKLLFGKDAVSVAPSEGYGWNAYVYRDWGGSREFRDFVTGGYYDYLVFKMKVLKKLIEKLNEELSDAEKRIEKLNEEWEKVMGRR
jgi:hypothetical protein